jgi:hypothetical protein
MNEALGIRSPSTVAIEIGQRFGEGLSIGLDQSQVGVEAAGANLADSLSASLADNGAAVVATAEKIVSDAFQTLPAAVVNTSVASPAAFGPTAIAPVPPTGVAAGGTSIGQVTLEITVVGPMSEADADKLGTAVGAAAKKELVNVTAEVRSA